MQTLEQEVNEPKHYRTHPSGIEAIDVTRYLGFDLGNTWKYCMRYRDKGTSKKDLKKSLWYIEDFRKNFIDVNNESKMKWYIPIEVYDKMKTIIDLEETLVIKEMFKQIFSIVNNGGILNPSKLNNVISELEKYSESFSV